MCYMTMLSQRHPHTHTCWHAGSDSGRGATRRSGVEAGVPVYAWLLQAATDAAAAGAVAGQEAAAPGRESGQPGSRPEYGLQFM